MKKILSLITLVAASSLLVSGCNNKNADVYENGKLVLKLKNAYFESWSGNDVYTEFLENKFGVKIKPSSYDYDNWGTQVSSAVYGDNLPDVFHFDLESFNFGNTYKTWANGKIIKALPTDMSNWPNIQRLINNVSNVESLKIDGKMYGIPLLYNTEDSGKDFSSFTYVYRRDWVKQIDASHCNGGMYDEGYPIFRENDIYTFTEFKNMLAKMKENISMIQSGDACAIADVKWGFPSLTNFYKDSPHCYTERDGRVVNAFTTEEYIKGINLTRQLRTDGLYFDQGSNRNPLNDYKSNKVGVYYDNFSLVNYSSLRQEFKNVNAGITESELNDATAFLKVKGEDNKFHLEGSENWFSMTMFNYDISDNKMNKILDLLDYLLTKEGTMLAIYGKEGEDYTVNDGEVELNERIWLLADDGSYAPIENGAKLLREMVTLNYDTSSYDPFVDKKSYQIVNAWQQEMKQAKQDGNLITFQEPAYIKWLSTPKKDNLTSGLITLGNDHAMNYICLVSGYATKEDYISKFNIAKWNDTIAEINRYLGK